MTHRALCTPVGGVADREDTWRQTKAISQCTTLSSSIYLSFFDTTEEEVQRLTTFKLHKTLTFPKSTVVNDFEDSKMLQISTVTLKRGLTQLAGYNNDVPANALAG